MCDAEGVVEVAFFDVVEGGDDGDAAVPEVLGVGEVGVGFEVGAEDEVGGGVDEIPVVDVGEVVEVEVIGGEGGFFVLMDKDEEGE